MTENEQVQVLTLTEENGDGKECRNKIHREKEIYPKKLKRAR